MYNHSYFSIKHLNGLEWKFGTCIQDLESFSGYKSMRNKLTKRPSIDILDSYLPGVFSG